MLLRKNKKNRALKTVVSRSLKCYIKFWTTFLLQEAVPELIFQYSKIKTTIMVIV